MKLLVIAQKINKDGKAFNSRTNSVFELANFMQNPVMADNEAERRPFDRNESKIEDVYYANPLIIHGSSLDYDRFSIKTLGMFSVCKSKPLSKELIALPFKVYLRRNGKIIQDFPNEGPYQIEISRILEKSKAGDQLIVEPIEKKDWKAKRILNIFANPLKPAESLVFDIFNKNC